MYWSQVVKPHLLTLICLACLVTVTVNNCFFVCFFYPIYEYLFDYFCFISLAINPSLQTCTVVPLLIHRAHPAHFKECEKWVQKSNLTKGCLESMGEALLCKGLMVCWEKGLYISALLDVLCSCWTAYGGGWQERWDKYMVSCELNRGASSKVWSTSCSMCLCEMIHEWPDVLYLKRFVPKACCRTYVKNQCVLVA